MALGYTIATILKRVSKVYSDDELSVKVDKLEMLQQKFIQVDFLISVQLKGTILSYFCTVQFKLNY